MRFSLGIGLSMVLGLLACKASEGSDAGALGAAGAPVAPPAAGTGAPGAAGTASIVGAGGAGGSAAPGDVPCEVATVLKQHCVRCHGNTLREGAPLSLVDAASFGKDPTGMSIGVSVLARVRSAERPMPPLPSPPLTAAEISTLEGWIGPGALPVSSGCRVDDTPKPPAAGNGGSGVTVVNQAGSGGAGGSGAPGGPAPTDETADWTMFGVDLSNSRNNAGEKTLSPQTVKGLKELWTFNGPATTSTPAVVDGVVYLPTWDGKVHALRLEDGMTVWTAMLPDLIDSSPAVTETQVFVSDDNGSVHAIERTSGKVQWSKAVDPHVEAHLWSSPVYIPDAKLIVVGVASGEEAVQSMMPTFRGSVVALDAATGNERWRFLTADPAKGSGPGIAIWATAAVDPARKALYIGTGNNYVEPFGELADSMLAINYETGALIWSRQFQADDAFTIFAPNGPDYDIGASANLFSVDGKEYVGIGVKNGIYYALDRETGAISWMTMITAGGALGGVISSSAYANGMIFVASNDMAVMQTTVVAINAKDGSIVWRHNTPNMTYGGVAHANGVVYVGTNAGSIVALDGATGTMLWVDQTPMNAPIGGGAAVAHGKLFLPWGYRWTLREGVSGTGGLTVYGL